MGTFNESTCRLISVTFWSSTALAKFHATVPWKSLKSSPKRSSLFTGMSLQENNCNEKKKSTV